MDFINFLIGTGHDGRGRTLADYMAFDAAKWEACHDHIQWAFPTKTKSAYNPNAPVVPEDFTFEPDYRVKQAILDLMVNYFKSLGITIQSATNGRNFVSFVHDGDTDFWIVSADHNMKRLTRLIECLGIFDMEAIQRDLVEFLLYDFAMEYEACIPHSTVVYWLAAWENKQHLLKR